MSTLAQPAGTRPEDEWGELRLALAAVRAQRGLVALLLALAAVAWWSTAVRMAGMDAGPGTDLGALGWFTGVWVVMMAAMMLPSLALTVALYAKMTRQRGIGQALLFTGGYLLVWGAAGLLAYGGFELGKLALGRQLGWHAGGRPFVAAVLLVAGVYELTPLKDACLGKCRSPLGNLLGRWHNGRLGALSMGAGHAGWCLGCCWALMAALFALGIMSLAWMAFVAALIAVEKMIPWRRVATWGTAAILAVLAVAVLLAPGSVPALTIPGRAAMAMQAMH